MRKILFRGKDKKTNEWSYGSLMCFHGYQIYDNTRGSWVSVKGETIGQYTGLTDKNDNKVFEGDILKVLDCFDNEVIYLIDYKDSAFCANQKGVNFSTLLSNFNSGEYCIEIIGNIFDNPELLEEK